jgi:hypothetical protein
MADDPHDKILTKVEGFVNKNSKLRNGFDFFGKFVKRIFIN